MVQMNLFGKPVAAAAELPPADVAEPPEKKPRPSATGRGLCRGHGRGGGKAAASDDPAMAATSASASRSAASSSGTPMPAPVVNVDDDDDHAGSPALAVAHNAIMLHEPQGTIVMGNLQLQSPGPHCTKCGFNVDPLKPGTRVVRKIPPTFQCNKCNSKATMLNRMVGSWPPEEFKDIPIDVMQKFWASPIVDKQDLKKSVENMLVSRMVESQVAEDVGPFLPLKTWGEAPYHFDTEEIKQKAPMRLHPILGETYQVKIVSTGERKQRDIVREQMAKLLSKGKLPSALPAAAPAVDREEEEEEPAADSEEHQQGSEDDDSMSSSTSSSSTDDKNKKTKKGKYSKKSESKKDKKKKAKHTKKEKKKAKRAAEKKKKAEKEALADAKKEKARIIKVKDTSSKVLAKTACLTMQYDQLLKDSSVSMLPVMLVKKAKDLHTTLVDFEKEAKDKLKAKTPLDLTFTMEEVTAAYKEAMSNKAVLTTMFESLKKM